MLFRAIFWFSLVVMLVPVKNDRMNLHSQNVSSLRTLSLMQSVAIDITSFCDRNPQSCDAASALVKNYGARVQAHAKQFGGLFDGEKSVAERDKITTGAIIPRQ